MGNACKMITKKPNQKHFTEKWCKFIKSPEFFPYDFTENFNSVLSFFCKFVEGSEINF